MHPTSTTADRLGGWFPLILLVVLAGVTFWLDGIAQPPAGSTSQSARTDPDYVVEGLAAVRMDAKGEVKHRLRATRMTHFAEEDLTFLSEPQFVTYAEGSAPVTVTAETARMSGNGENVYFEDNVRVVRASDPSRAELVLETEYLHVIPDANVARTDKPVRIRNASSVVTAAGMELNSETRILKLDGRVKGTFDGSRTGGR